MITIGKKRISIPMILFMYVLIYNPPLLAPVFRNNSVWLVMLPSVAYVLLHLKELKEFTNFRAVVCTEAVLGVFLVYLMAMAKINGNPITSFGFFVYWMAGVIPFALACWISLRKKGLGFAELLDHLLITGLVMAATAIAAFLVPAVKEFFVERMIAYGIPYVIKLSCYRYFGLAANLTSTAAYAQITLASIALYRGIREKPLWLLAFPMLAFSANINVRTTVYLMLAGMAAVLAGLLFTKNLKMIGKFFLAAVPALAIAYFGLELVRLVNPMTYDWLGRGIEQVSSFVGGEEVPYSDGYFQELAWMLAPEHFPRGIRLVFGAGTEIMGTVVEDKYGVSSDVGFMNDLWRGGLVYLVSVTALYLRTLWQMARSRTVRRETGIFLAVLCLFFFGITNIKGHFFIHSDLTVIIWILITALVFNRTETGKENRENERIEQGI